MKIQSLAEYRNRKSLFRDSRVLVADDDATVRTIHQRYLENAGFIVCQVSSGAEAMRRLEEETFDLMLLDNVMPDMNGLAVVKAVRQQYNRHQLPIIMVTVQEDSEDVVEALSMGANDYLVKPVDFPILLARIEIHLSQKQAEEKLREAHDALEQRVEDRTADLLATNQALINEITERRNAEEELRRIYVLYRQAEQVGRLGHWEWDHVNDTMTSCSEEFARIHEMTIEEALNHFSSWQRELDSVHPEDRLFYEQHIENCEKQKCNVDIEYRAITQNGNVRHIHLRSKYVFDGNGKIIGSIGTEQDISWRKSADEAIRDSEQRFQVAFEHAAIPISIAQANGEVIKVNRAYTELLGYSEEEILDIGLSVITHPDDLKQEMRQYQRMRAGEIEDFTMEKRLTPKTGVIIWVETHVTAVRDSAGDIVQFMSQVQDITRRKEADEEIRHLAYHDELTGLPTLRLSKDRLTSAIALARRNNVYLAVLFVDLDSFKEINDTMGHKAGDDVLKIVARRMMHCVRDSDTVARIGGDEFIIILTDLDEETDAEKVAAKLISSLTRSMRIDEVDVTISASIGIALNPQHGETPEELIEKADQTMYEVKKKGKNNFLTA